MYLVRQHRPRAAGAATLVAALALVVTAAIGGYHAGVELHLWEGTAACGSTGPAATSAAALRDQLMRAPVVRCDEIAWSLFGISMAGWNLILSGALAVLGLRGGLALLRAQNR
jgi:disulfide bond formation protein DsbB